MFPGVMVLLESIPKKIPTTMNRWPTLHPAPAAKVSIFVPELKRLYVASSAKGTEPAKILIYTSRRLPDRGNRPLDNRICLSICARVLRMTNRRARSWESAFGRSGKWLEVRDAAGCDRARHRIRNRAVDRC